MNPAAICPYLEAQDDGPDEAEGQPVVPIHDVMGAHVLKMDSLLLQELKGLVHILQTVDAHSSLGGFRLESGEQKAETDYVKGCRQAESYCPELQWARSCSTLVPTPKPSNTCVLVQYKDSVYLTSLPEESYLRDRDPSSEVFSVMQGTQFIREHRSWKVREKGTQSP